MMALLSHRKSLRNFFRDEVWFFTLIIALFLVAYLIFPYTQYAMWFGFAVAGYSTIANDSIQTLGTFISSNRTIRWWMLWLFIGGILVVTHTHGWFADGGDIAFGRLSKIPQPESYTLLKLSAPIILLVLTRFRMPVSTTFLLLSVFSDPEQIQKMLNKTFLGYIVAFVVALLFWGAIAYLHKREFTRKHYNVRNWRILQACSTTFLWWTWITHDTANVAVFLPRTLSIDQLLLAVGYLFFVVGLVMYWKGGRIQVVVTEKKDVVDVRAATMIDFVYAFVLLYFKEINSIPMSTTWVFLGLLAGREIALTMLSDKEEPYKTTAKLVLKDIWRAGLGLLISLLIVVSLV